MSSSRSKTRSTATASKIGLFSRATKGSDTRLSNPSRHLNLDKETIQRSKERATLPVSCICLTGDDGTPMVLCNECLHWYHFRCIDLREEDAEELCLYVCPNCYKMSRRQTTMLWEGLDAMEVIEDERWDMSRRKLYDFERTDQHEGVQSELEERSSSEDEYIGDSPKGRRKNTIRRISSSSGSDSSTSDNPKLSRHRLQKHPPQSGLKREAQITATPPPKRKKPDIPNASDDPTRKYCLGKFEDLFSDIFCRCTNASTGYQIVEDRNRVVPENFVGESTLIDNALLDKAQQFARNLECSVFEKYSELDRHGLPSAGSKYKDRFRMLQFNLSKPDRLLLHQRIVSGVITPREISLMSSTELANEETKQSIKNAEKEALEHSILMPTVVPRAKITHKGLEDIEDIHGHSINTQLDESSRLEEVERRERERMARLRSQGKQREASTSIPPASPLDAPPVPSWGSSPKPTLVEETIANLAEDPTYIGSVSSLPPPADLQHVEPELNIAEFINIDDVPAVIHSPSSPGSTLNTSFFQDNKQTELPSVYTGLLPSATEEVPKPYFNLDALWNKPKTETVLPVAQQESRGLPSSSAQIKADVALGSGSLVTDDQDFDVFLDEKDSPVNSMEDQQAVLDALPHVWVGKINMPLDSTIPQETLVFARQVGGRPIHRDSGLWKILFPTEILRIDGRVPVENSSKFLLQMRLNYTKELIAVAFSPASESNDVGFRILSDFLIAKGRHGLVFPWGTRLKDCHPGRELYIIPLLSSDPLPDYMEVLEHFHLPKLRKINLLVGIWILNKGKLITSPPPPPEEPVFPTMPQNIQSLISNMSQQSTAPILPRPPPPLPANIATEVASLTPEQVQSMIQNLTRNGSFPVPQPIPQHTQQQLSVHLPDQFSAIQPYSLPDPSQRWPINSPDYGSNDPPLYALSHGNQPPLRHDIPSIQRHDYRGSRFRPDRDREDRSSRRWRSRGSRGRPSGNESPRKPVDSGWPRRSRPDSAAAEPSSPSRRW